MIYPCHMGATQHKIHGRSRRWRPTGPVAFHADPAAHASEAQKNPIEAIGDGENLAARFFVGLNVGKVTRWTPKDVADVVWRVRKAQGENGSTSIISQLGLYESDAGDKVEEPSVQVVVLDLSGAPRPKFFGEMTEVGETLARELHQETVILEMQKRGVVEAVYVVTP